MLLMDVLLIIAFVLSFYIISQQKIKYKKLETARTIESGGLFLYHFWDNEKITERRRSVYMHAYKQNPFCKKFLYIRGNKMNKKSRNIISAILCIVLIISCAELTGISTNKVCAASQYAYFVEATKVTYKGQTSHWNSETSGSAYGYKDLYVYKNTSIDSSKYVLYENCVKASDGTLYDLVVYPFMDTTSAMFHNKKLPTFTCSSGTKRAGYKLVITKHGNMDAHVNMRIKLGFSDLDHSTHSVSGDSGGGSYPEFVILPNSFQCIYQGKDIMTTDETINGSQMKKYGGTVYNANKNVEKYDYSCVFGLLDIPTDGIVMYHGGPQGLTTELSFEEIQKYVDENGYTIEFNANDGSGSVPNPIIKYGTDTSTIMGDISNTVPTRSGYVFRGWSASSSFNSKRIAYSSSSGGSAASDGTTATTTSSSWSYATYCEKTGGNASNRTLTLYAQWEYAPSYTHTLVYDANGGNGAPSSATVTNTSSTYSLTVSSTQPTRTGYTFDGWNTNSSGTGTNYSAGGSVSVGANATVTLYAKWTPNSSTLKVNPNGGIWSGSSSEQSFTQNYGTTKDIPVPTRTGYTFTGWTRENTYGSMSSLTESATYTFGATNGVTDTITANWQLNNYDVTYIDVVKETGKELGRSTESKPYESTVKGIDKGASTTDNEYYKNYALISGTEGYTTATVNTSNNTVVYRYFRWLTTDIAGTVNWTDNYNAYETRPDKVKIVIFQNGIPVTSVVTVSGTKDIEPIILSTSGDINHFEFPDMPAYDSAGNPYTYDIRMYDLDATVDIKNPSSVMSLEYPESKYVTTQNGYDIYNKLDNNVPDESPDDPEGFTVSGAIHWVDSGNKLGLRPSTVTIALYQDGEPFMVNGKHYTITVDAINDNTYKFIKLPKYKYVDGQPVPYEYTAVETIVSNYVKDGVIYPLYDIHTDENMGEYEKLHFTNYIKIDGPIIPIIPTDERDNTITVITNTEDKVDIVLKMLDFYITETPEDVNVQYGPGYNGDEYNLSVSELGEIIKHLPSGKYEIDINESKYVLKDIHISDNTDNVYITYEDGKYYLVIDHVPGDSWGTVNIELEKKTEYYQTRKSINNYFKAPFAKRIVGGYIELPEDRDVSVVKKLMMRNYFIEAVSTPVSAELPEGEETTETDTPEIENTEDSEEEEDSDESTFIIEAESEETDNSIEDLENDSSETPDIILGN